YLGDHRHQLLLLFQHLQIPIQMLMKSLLAYSHRPIHLVHFVAVPFPLRPEPAERGVEYFFLISTPYSASASSIILSKKSICICFCPTVRSNSFIFSFNAPIFFVSLNLSTTIRSCFFLIREYCRIHAYIAGRDT